MEGKGKGKGVKRKVVEVDADGCTSRIGTLVNGLQCIIRENRDFYEYTPTNGLIFYDPLLVVAAGGIPDNLKLKCEKALTFSIPSVSIKFAKKTASFENISCGQHSFVQELFKVNQYYLEAFNKAYKSSFGSSPKKYMYYKTDEEMNEKMHRIMLAPFLKIGMKLSEKPKLEAHTPVIEVCLNADHGMSPSLFNIIHTTVDDEGFRQKSKIVWMCKKLDMESCLVMASQGQKKRPLNWLGECIGISSENNPEEKVFRDYIEISSDDDDPTDYIEISSDDDDQQKSN